MATTTLGTPSSTPNGTIRPTSTRGYWLIGAAIVIAITLFYGMRATTTDATNTTGATTAPSSTSTPTQPGVNTTGANSSIGNAPTSSLPNTVPSGVNPSTTTNANGVAVPVPTTGSNFPVRDEKGNTPAEETTRQ